MDLIFSLLEFEELLKNRSVCQRWNEILLARINRMGPVLNLLMDDESMQVLRRREISNDNLTVIHNKMRMCKTVVRNRAINFKRVNIGYISMAFSNDLPEIFENLNSVVSLHILDGEVYKDVLYHILRGLENIKNVKINLKNPFDVMNVIEILADKATDIEINFIQTTTYKKHNIINSSQVQHLTFTNPIDNPENPFMFTTSFSLYESNVIELFKFLQPTIKTFEIPVNQFMGDENERLKWYNFVDFSLNQFEFSFMNAKAIDSNNLKKRVEQAKNIENATITVRRHFFQNHHNHIEYVSKNLCNVKKYEIKTDSVDALAVIMSNLVQMDKLEVIYIYNNLRFLLT